MLLVSKIEFRSAFKLYCSPTFPFSSEWRGTEAFLQSRLLWPISTKGSKSSIKACELRRIFKK